MPRGKITPSHFQKRDEIIRDIFKKKIEGFDDSDIIKLLNLQERTYYYYRDQLYDKIKLANLKKDDAYILAQQDVLSGRLNRIYQRLNERFENDVDNMKADELNLLVQKLQDLAIVIFKLDVEGLRVTKFISNFVSEQSKQIKETGGNREPLPRLVYNQSENKQQEEKQGGESNNNNRSIPDSTTTTADSDRKHDISGNVDDSEEVF